MERNRQGPVPQIGQALLPQPEADPRALDQPPRPRDLQVRVDYQRRSPHRHDRPRKGPEVGVDSQDGRRPQNRTHDKKSLLCFDPPRGKK